MTYRVAALVMGASFVVVLGFGCGGGGSGSSKDAATPDGIVVDTMRADQTLDQSRPDVVLPRDVTPGVDLATSSEGGGSPYDGGSPADLASNQDTPSKRDTASVEDVSTPDGIALDTSRPDQSSDQSQPDSVQPSDVAPSADLATSNDGRDGPADSGNPADLASNQDTNVALPDAAPDLPCPNHWTGASCNICPPNWDSTQGCNACAPGYVGAACTQCVRYVTTAGDDTHPGTSWANAKATVQAGITAALDAVSAGAASCQVWVQAGSYYIYKSAVTDTVQLRSFLPVYGSFAGTETAVEQRSFTTPTSILDGRASAGSTDRVRHVVTGLQAAQLNGFIVQYGQASPGTGTYDGCGGGLYNNFTNISTVIIERCSFRFNNAASDGGAIFNRNTTLSLTDVEFYSNQATGRGAGIMGTASSLSLTNSTFRDQKVSSTNAQGAAIYIDGQLTMTGGTFTENQARGEGAMGGAIYCPLLATVTLTNVAFTWNAAAGAGGAIYGNNCSIIGTGLTFLANKVTESLSGGVDPIATPGHGGAIYAWTYAGVQPSRLAIDQSQFIQNQTASGGGAIYLVGSSTTDLISRSSFLSNKSVYANGGAVMLAIGSTARVENSLFAGNVTLAPSMRGGALYVEGASPTVMNCTLARNHATSVALNAGGGIATAGSGATTVRNTVLWANNLAGNNYAGLGVGTGTTIDTTYSLDSNTSVGFGGVSTPGNPSTFESMSTNTYVVEGTDSAPAAAFFTANAFAGMYLHLDEPRTEVLPITSNTTSSITAYADGRNMTFTTPVPYTVETFRPTSVATSLINQGTSTGAPTVDILGRTRVSTPDIGAFEYIP